LIRSFPATVQAAYDKLRDAKRQAKIGEEIPILVGIFAVPLELLCFLGWMAGWAIRGFRRP
jgi:hypothetical protein